LRASVHLHTVAFDGVFVQTEPDGPVVFHALPKPEPDDLQSIAGAIVRAATRLLEGRGLCWDPAQAAEQGLEVEDPVAHRSPLLAECCAHSMQGIVTVGPNRGQPLAGSGSAPRLVLPKDLRRKRTPTSPRSRG
jgi:hypothetical protein